MMIDYCRIKPEVNRMVKRIPDPLIFPFSVFMRNNGYTISAVKDGIIYRKGKAVAKIPGAVETSEQSYAMNEHCSMRFKTFTELYLKIGYLFIEELNRQGLK